MLYIDDSVYGNHNITSFNPQSTGSVSVSISVQGYSTDVECTNTPATHSISTTITYILSCHSGTPNYLQLGVTYWECCGGNGGLYPSAGCSGGVGGTGVASAHVNLPRDCTFSTPIDFNINAEGLYPSGNPKLYPTGVTITLHI